MIVRRSEGINRFSGFLQSPLFISLLVAAITLATFGGVLSADFVMWDDDVVVYKSGLKLEGYNSNVSSA